jgi:hypothetical protein
MPTEMENTKDRRVSRHPEYKTKREWYKDNAYAFDFYVESGPVYSLVHWRLYDITTALRCGVHWWQRSALAAGICSMEEMDEEVYRRGQIREYTERGQAKGLTHGLSYEDIQKQCDEMI